VLASSLSQLKRLIVTRYSSRNGTVRDHAMVTDQHRNRRSPQL
jgi:hypothetical protein